MSEQVSEARMFAALSAINEAIVRSRARDELFQRVCDAAVHAGGFRAASALLPDNDGRLRYVARAVPENERPADLHLSVDENSEYGQGLAGTAFRERRLCLSRDILNDGRLSPWHDIARSQRVHAAAGIPILDDGSSIGVFLFFFSETNALSNEIIGLIERIAENVSFGLATFERERRRDDVTRMFAALSATNEAILRAGTREELCNLVCEAAVLGGTFTCARIAFVEPDRQNLRISAAAGRGKDTAIGILSRLNANESEGTSIGGTAFMSAKPSISNDYLSDARPLRMRDRLRELGTRAIAAFPLFRQDQPIGAITLQSNELNAFTTERVDLLRRLADNVSFALANFDRAEEKKQADERIRYLASHDALTGLPNRATFNELLEQAIKSARRRESGCALLFIDLDHFKAINDTLGHTAGDLLLIEIAKLLRSGVRENDVVARLGGDEFVVILEDIKDKGQASIVAQKLLATLAALTSLGEMTCRATASIGVAIFPDHGTDADSLIRNADAAMYQAKEDGKNDFRLFSSEVEPLGARATVEAVLRHALECNQYTLRYQPRFDASSHEVGCIEAVVAWEHLDLDLTPEGFVAAAEQTGVMVPLGRWLFSTACAQFVAWQRTGFGPIVLAVGLTQQQFRDIHLARDIEQVLIETGMPPDLVQLELAESTVLRNFEYSRSLLRQLKSNRMRIAIRDFGAGGSSLSLLKELPIDAIHLDHSLVGNTEHDANRAITTAIASLRYALGLAVVANGAATHKGRGAADLPPNFHQEQLVGKPMSPDGVLSLLKPFVFSPSIQPTTTPFPEVVRSS